MAEKRLIPTTANVQSPTYFGRTRLFAPYQPENLTDEIILKILSDVFDTHTTNSNQIEYLLKYYKGNQPILKKTKRVRPDVNNIIIENHAYSLVEFKKGYVFGKPIQYVQTNDVASNEITELNKYMSSEDKASKDKDLAEWLYICGQGYRVCLPDKRNEIENSPFEIYNLDPRYTFVVYSSFIENKELLSCNYITYKDFDGNYRRKYQIYTQNKYYELISQSLNGLNSVYKITNAEITMKKSHTLGHIPVIEYFLNQNRLGLVEIVASGLDALNNLTSCELDDVQQFVQSLLVFTNQEIDIDTFSDLISLGAIKIKSDNPNTPAKVEMLTANLSYNETQILYDNIYNNVLTICGVPRMNDKPSGGDTGQARLLGEGWTIADMRANQDELSFKISEKKFLKLALRICKDTIGSAVSTINVSDIDIKFSRNKSDNLLVKTQGLINLKNAGIHPLIAMTTVDLFSDVNDVFNKSDEWLNGNLWKEGARSDSGNNSTNSNNSIGSDNNTFFVDNQNPNNTGM